MKERKIVLAIVLCYLFMLGYQVADLRVGGIEKKAAKESYEAAAISEQIPEYMKYTQQQNETEQQQSLEAQENTKQQQSLEAQENTKQQQSSEGQENIKQKKEREQLANLLHAKGAVLMDGYTGRVLYGKNEEEELPMASTTKIMTCIVTLEQADPEEMVEVSPYAASMPDVQLSICAGERYRLKDLLLSLMLESHNDSAVAIAEYIGEKAVRAGLVSGTGENPVSAAKDRTTDESRRLVAAFAKLMNQKAGELGCEHTCFITPNGLDSSMTVETETGEPKEKIHSTTAAELAAIMRYCVSISEKREQFLEITRTRDAAFADAEGKRSFSCTNHNRYLDMRQGALSGKTGFTGKAGYCYIGAVKEQDRFLIIALLACGWPPSKTLKWKDMETLVTYGLKQYQYTKIGGREKMQMAYRFSIRNEKGRKTGSSIDLKADIQGEEFEGLLGEGETVKNWWYLDLPVQVQEGDHIDAEAGWYETVVENTAVHGTKLEWHR